MSWLKGYLHLLVVAERVPEIRVLGTRSTVEKWYKGKLNKAFLHFLHHLMIFQCLKNHQIRPTFGKNLTKISLKALFNLPWTHFSVAIGYPFRHYLCTTLRIKDSLIYWVLIKICTFTYFCSDVCTASSWIMRICTVWSFKKLKCLKSSWNKKSCYSRTWCTSKIHLVLLHT